MQSRQGPGRTRVVRPSLEGLEARELLSAAPASSAAITALRARRLPILDQLPSAPEQTTSTVPANGDVNPYGVAFVPAGFARGGVLKAGDVLVSNFNNSGNLQGTGTTIVAVTPSGQSSVFYQGPQGLGLTTALGVLKGGYVLVGNVPSTDGTSATVGQGSLIVLNKNGQLVANLTDSSLLDGPWDLALNDQGSRAQIYVSDVLSGTVSRIDVKLSARNGFQVVSETQIASGYTHRGDPAAFELGPTGLAFDARTDTLYVASTADNAIYAVAHANVTKSDHGTGAVIYQDTTHLHGPLGLALAPDGNLITANGDAINTDPNQPSELVEFTRKGQFVAQFSVNSGLGGAFGVTISAGAHPKLAAVDDVSNSVHVWQVSA